MGRRPKIDAEVKSTLYYRALEPIKKDDVFTMSYTSLEFDR